MPELQLPPNAYRTTYKQPFDTPNGTAYITEVEPIADTSDRTPLLISPGLLNPSERLMLVLEEFARNGRHAIAVEHNRRGGNIKRAELASASDQYPKVEIGKAETLRRLIDSREIERVDLLGYCEGAVNGAILAAARPDRVRGFLLLNPAGMMGDDSFLRIARLFLGKSIRDISQGLHNHSVQSLEGQTTGKMGLIVDRLLGLPTLYHLSRTRIEERLVEIAGQGVAVGVLQSCRDSLYPYEIVAGHVPDTITHASLADRRLGHAAIYTHRQFVVGAIVQFLEGMKTAPSSSQPEANT